MNNAVAQCGQLPRNAYVRIIANIKLLYQTVICETRMLSISFQIYSSAVFVSNIPALF